MPAKVVGCLMKVAAVVFTSIAAPILVDIVVKSVKVEANPSAAPRPEPSPNFTIPAVKIASKTSFASPGPEAADIIQVIAHGTGKTPAEALQDALRTALRQALALPGERLKFLSSELVSILAPLVRAFLAEAPAAAAAA